MKEVAKELVLLLIDHPDDLEVEEKEQNNLIYITINAHEDDRGKIIGKQGKNIMAIRTLLKANAAKEKFKGIVVDIAGA